MAPHGVRGEVKATILTEEPGRFARLTRVYLGDVVSPTPYALEDWRLHKGHVLLRLAGVQDRNAAESLRGQWVLVPVAEALPLEPDEFYICQLVGLEVWTTAGKPVGRVIDVVSAGPNDVLVIEGPRGEVLVPFAVAVVPEVDLAAGRLVVEPLEGLF